MPTPRALGRFDIEKKRAVSSNSSQLSMLTIPVRSNAALYAMLLPAIVPVCDNAVRLLS